MNIINEKWNTYIAEAEFDTSNLHPKDSMHPDYWHNLKLDSRIHAQLIEIAEDIIEQLDLRSFVEDIVLTGSIAGYNWHNLSDVDLHILIDFSKIDENTELVKKFLDNRRMNWNKAHKILIKGHEVEIYFQDINEKHESPGLFSLMSGQWLVDPVKMSREIDIPAIKSKAQAIANEIEEVSNLFNNKDFQLAYETASSIKEKIKKLRQSGLERDGINSVENMAFKLLRNNNFLSSLSSLKVLAYDKMMSINGESAVPSRIKIKIQENWRRFLRNE